MCKCNLLRPALQYDRVRLISMLHDTRIYESVMSGFIFIHGFGHHIQFINFSMHHSNHESTETSTASTLSSTTSPTSTSALVSTSTIPSTSTLSSTEVSTTEESSVTPAVSSTTATETSTVSSQTSTEALTSTSASASTTTAAETSTASSTQSSTSEGTTVTSLPTTSVVDTLTASSQTSTEALTSTSASASTTTAAETSTASSIQSSTSEGTTVTSLPTTNATETSTASTLSSTTSPTSTSALVSTSTIPSTSTLSSTEVSTTEESSVTPAVSSTTESPAIPTTVTSSATPVTTSEASTTQITTLLTVEPPIVPVTVKPDEGIQEKQFNITFTVLKLPFTPALQNLNSSLYTTESTNIRDALSNLYSNQQMSTFLHCRSVSFRPASDGNSTVEAICTFKKSANNQQVDKIQIYREFQNNTRGITTLGTHTLDSNSLYVDGYHESAVVITPTEISTANTQRSTTAQTSTSIHVSTNTVTQRTSGSSSKASISGSTTVTAPLSTSGTEMQTTNTQTSRAALTSTSALAPSNAVAETPTASSTEASPEATTLITSLPSASATEMSTTSTQGLTTSPTSSSAPVATSTISSTATLASTEGSTTETLTITPLVTSTTAERQTSIANTQTSTAVQTSTSALLSTLTSTSNTTVSSSEAPTTEAITITTLLPLTNATETVRTNTQTSTEALISTSAHASTSTTVETSTASSTETSKFEATTMTTTHLPTSVSETSTASTKVATAATTPSLIRASTRSTASTSTLASTEGSTTEAITFSLSVSTTTAETLTTSSQTSTAAPTSPSAPGSTSTVAETSAASLTEAKTTITSLPSTSVATEHLTVSAQTSTATQTTTSAPAATRSKVSTPAVSSTTGSTTEVTSITISLSSTSAKTLINTQVSTEALTSTSASTSTATAAETSTTSLTQTSTSEVTTVTSLPMTTAATQPSTANAQSSTTAQISTSASASTSTSPPTTVGNSTKVSTTEAMTVTASVPSTNAETSVASTGSLTTSMTSSSAAASTSTIASTSTLVSTEVSTTEATTFTPSASSTTVKTLNGSAQRSTTAATSASASPVTKKSLTEVSSTESTTVFTTLPSPSESSSISTSSGSETSTQISTALPSTSTATPVTTSEASSTQTTKIMTVEPPIVPATVNPNEGIQGKEFNITFTVLKLPFTPTLQDHNSSLYISESNNILDALSKLYAKSEVKSSLLHCQSISFRPASDGNSTVEVICTFKISANTPQVDKVGLYHEFQNNTKDITTLGPYTLDSNSLYVNGYHESTVVTTTETLIANTQTSTATPTSTSASASTSTAAETSAASSMQTSTSEATTVTSHPTTRAATKALTANKQPTTASSTSSSVPALTSTAAATSTASSIQTSISEAMTVTSIPSTSETLIESTQASTATVHSTSSKITSATTVRFTEVSTTEATTVTKLASVEPPIIPATVNPNEGTQEREFNITFTVLTLPFTPNLQNLSSPLYLAVSSNILDNLSNLYANSKVKSTFLKCWSARFRPASDGNSTVEAICTFKKTGDTSQTDKVKLYREFQINTKGITTLGNYTLDSSSLYIDGYHESTVLTTTLPTVTTTQLPSGEGEPVEFNVTFVITNLEFTESLQNSSSLLYNSVSSNISYQLTDLYNKSKINKRFSDCKAVSFSPADVGNTRVYAICTFRNDSDPPEVNRITVYRTFRDNTKNISTLGIYILDNNSLYVNGYHETTPLPTKLPTVTTTETPSIERKPIEFNVTFVTTSLELTESLQNSSSSLYNSVSNNISSQLTDLYKKSNINTKFSDCKVVSFSPADDASTRVYAICTFRNDSDPQEVNRVTVYRTFRDNTENISTLGQHTLDNNSLYVNGYHETTPLPTTLPTVTTTQPPSVERKPIEFNVTFVITNLELTEDLQNSSSSLYNSVSNNISYQLTTLYNKSNINASFSDCKVVSFSPADDANTRVYAICTFRNDSDLQKVNRVTVYRTFRDNTENISTLGQHTLDNNSLYVNGYHETTPLPTTLPTVTTTQPPSVERKPIEFNVTFVITNLELTEDLQNSSSSLYNSVSNNISYQLTTLYNKSNINASFSDCKVVSFSPADDANTRVYAICTFRNDSDLQKVNRVTVYRTFRDNTENISTLGQHTLDNNSLYVNGYHETTPLPTTLPTVTTTQPPSVERKPIEFNVTFVITNLELTEDLQNSSSSLYNSVSNNISYQLTTLYNKSNINASFSDCKVVSFSPADDANTRVYAICTFRNDSDPQEVNRVTVYRTFRDNTENISTLGQHTLDNNSLYVNGYHETTPLPTTLPTVTTTQPPSVERKPIEFNVTFVITNLELTEDLQNSSSSLYNSVSNNISYQLTTLYNKSNINASFSDCKVVSFSPADDANTRVYAICTFRNDSDPQEVNRVTVYRTFRDNTENISTLGQHTLDNNSLYVNGYHETTPLPTTLPTVTTTQPPSVERKPIEFNVTFVITNLELTEDLQNSSSSLYNSVSNNISYQLTTLYNKSNINASFSDCKVVSFSPADDANTRVYAICTFRNDSDPQEVNRVTVYRTFRDNTENISTLGQHTLDNNSLYVNGYHETTPLPTTLPTVTTTQPPSVERKPIEFNVTFVITNLELTEDLQNSSSSLYNSVSNNISYQLTTLYNKSNINASFSDCKVVSFSPADDANTRVYAICTFRNYSDPQEVNRVTVYRTFRDNTENISTLGQHTLDNNSLYVNDYHELIFSSTISPIMSTTPNPETKTFDFNVTFIITNLAPTTTLQESTTALYKSAASIIAFQLDSLFNNSNINTTFSSCRVISLSLANIDDIGVYTICTFRNDSAAQEVNKVTVYHEFRDNTESISTLGSYLLDNNSLYVNGYHESTPSSTVSPIVSTTPNLQTEPFDFNVTFIITNLILTETLQSPNSALYRSATNIINYQMNNLFTNSKINRTFSSCRVRSFSLANIEDTSVDAVCTFRNDSNPQKVNKVTVYHTFRDNTKSISTLGAYLLDSNSLYVNGYHEFVPSSTISPIMSTIPNLQTESFDFNVTFVITNLNLTATLQSPSSALYKSAANIIANQMNNLFTNSKINRTFSSCRVRSFSVANIEDTSVDAVCTFRNDSNPQEVNKVTVYHTFRDNTKSISTLGAYLLDSNSLYVNDYHESVPLSTVLPIVSTTPNLQPFDFNVTFIVTNLALTATLQSPNSALYKSAANIIAFQMNNLFSNSKINRTFLSCKVRSFSLANIEDTSVDAVCIFGNKSDPQEVNKVTVYRTFRDNTKSISTLGAYSLDANSLYINDYHESVPSSTVSPTVSTTPDMQTKPFDFNVTFIVTNLALTATLQSSSSALYKSAANIITYQMTKLFTNSKINRTFLSCEVHSFSLANIEDTSVDAVCSFRNDSNPQQVNKVTVYHTFRDNTKSISTLGAYSLDHTSLYVNDYHESVPSSTVSPTVSATPNLQTKPFDFNVTFIITNLALTANLQSSSSALYKSAANIIAYQLNSLFTNSKINRTFSSCRVHSFSQANIEDTSVDIICSFRNDSDPLEVTKVTIYHTFRDNTKGISTLGAYSLDHTSLYVNDYHESIPSSTISPTVSTTPNMQTKPFDFNVTFIITNLVLTANLQSSTSALYKSAANIIAYQLNNLFTNSKIDRTFSSCRVRSFSLANIEDTSVDAVCSFRNDSNPLEVNKVTVYHTFRDNTNSIFTLGAYSLDHTSLYVNDYHESIPSSTISPTVSTTPNLQTKPFDFNVTFIITNLVLTANLQSSTSALYKSAANIIAYQLNNLFTNSKINRTFSSCRIRSFSLANIEDTSVDAVCSFRNDSNPLEVNKVTVYHTFRDNTKSIFTLGAYSLDHTSLYVNDYHESVPSSTEKPVVIVTQSPNEGTRSTDFNVTFTISNLTFIPDLQNLNSSPYKATSSHVINSLRSLYRNSEIKKEFLHCKLAGFRPGNEGNTKVEAICSFKNNPNVNEVDRVTVYNEFRDNTEKITALGIYALIEDSLYVDGYQELKPTVTPTITVPAIREGDLPFELNFTIINRNFTEALNDTNSPEYQSITANITRMLSGLFKKSSLKKSYRTSKVIGLRRGSVKCTCLSYFNPDDANELVTAEKVRKEFTTGTNATNLLGNVYQLKNNSLTVEAKAPISDSKVEIPYWGIILIVLGILLILFLFILGALLIALCLKKKHQGFYNMMQNPAGFYFPHQKFY
ncbi:mucin-16-like [Chiloscyllium punctatum]|uniref:mucin-16-like n=1 Tax=Chiloscyllium punctatum TaxID=137246 RepID=UPI003B63D54A